MKNTYKKYKNEYKIQMQIHKKYIRKIHTKNTYEKYMEIDRT